MAAKIDVYKCDHIPDAHIIELKLTAMSFDTESLIKLQLKINDYVIQNKLTIGTQPNENHKTRKN